MAQIEEKAISLKNEAIKKLTSKGFFHSFFGSNKIDQAIDYYQRSGNLFKMIKKWKEAAAVFNDAAELHSKKGEDYEAARNFINAANCSKKYDVDEAVRQIYRAIIIYTNIGKFATAAKYHQVIAELYEIEEMNMEKALEHYEQASEYFKTENNYTAAKTCLIKVAEHSSLRENYQKAIKIFQEIAKYELGNSLLRYSAKDHFFQAVLCQMCIDSVNIPDMVDKFANSCPFFDDSREHKFINRIHMCVEQGDLNQFNTTVKDYDSLSRFSTWHVTMLLRIKKKINDDPDLR